MMPGPRVEKAKLFIFHLIKLRASQINGCAYCLDMHWKDLRAIGETEQRMYSLDAWRECPYYTERERAALAWTEAVTHVTEGHVPDDVYDDVQRQFSEKELADLTVAIATINAWNRIAIAGRTTPGHPRLPVGRSLVLGDGPNPAVAGADRFPGSHRHAHSLRSWG